MAIGSTYIDLEWDPATDNVQVTSYQLRRNGSVVFNGNQLYYRDTSLNPETTYSYDVRAVDAAGNWSGYSSPINATTKAAGADEPSATSPTITVTE